MTRVYSRNKGYACTRVGCVCVCMWHAFWTLQTVWHIQHILFSLKDQEMAFEGWHFQALSFRITESKRRPKCMYLFLLKIKFVWNLLCNVITVIQDDLLDTSFMDHEGQEEGNNSQEPSMYLGELKIPFVINSWCLQRLLDHINVNSVRLEWLSESPIQKYPLFCSII